MQPSFAARPAFLPADSDALLAQDFFRLADVTAGFLQRLFAVHHAGAGLFAKGFDKFRVDLHCGRSHWKWLAAKLPRPTPRFVPGGSGLHRGRWRSAPLRSPRGSGRRGGIFPSQFRLRFGDGVGDHAGDEFDGANRVIVAGDRVCGLIGITIGVHDGNDRNIEALRLVDGDGLALDVDHEHRGGHPFHVHDAVEIAMQFALLATERGDLLLGQMFPLGRCEKAVDFLHPLHAVTDRAKVRERAAEPPIHHIRHVRADRGFFDFLLRLFLGADEQHGAAAGDGIMEKSAGDFDLGEGLVEVDDVNAVAGGENELLHLGVPPLGLVTEMNPGFQQFCDCYACQCILHCFIPRRHNVFLTRDIPSDNDWILV